MTTNMTRRAATAVAILTAGATVAQAETQLTISHYLPPIHGIQTDFLEPWSQAVSECSGGELAFEIQGAGTQLGNVARQQEQVLAGVSDIAVGLTGLPRGRFPRTSLIAMPFLTDDAGAASQVLWKLLPTHLAEEYQGMKVLALFAHNGGLIHTKDKPVATMEDLKGLRIRTPSPAVSEMLTQLGADPQGLPPGEVYENLQRGVIDGTVFPWDPVKSFGLNEVLTDHLDAGVYTVSFFFVMNQAKYDGLTDQEKACIDDNSGEALVAKFGDWWDAWDAPARAEAEAAGHTIVTLSDEERDRWREALAPMQQKYLETVASEGVDNAEEIYRAMQDAIAEYDAQNN